MDQLPSGLTLDLTNPLAADPPFITTAVDTVMYILDQTLQRSMATSQRSIIGSVVLALERVLIADFTGLIRQKMRNESFPRASIQGGLPPESKVTAFLVLMNNLDIASDYIKRIVEGQLAGQSQFEPRGSVEDMFPFGSDARFVRAALESLENSFAAQSRELLHDSIQVAFRNILQPRVRQIIAETFRDVNYQPDNQRDTDIELGVDDADVVQLRFKRGWSALIRPIKRILTPNSFDQLLVVALAYVATMLLSRIKGQDGIINELGAVRLEGDISGIFNAATASGNYALRDIFTKCKQMTLIMNLDEDEWDEVSKDEAGGLGVQWVLTAEERSIASRIVHRRIAGNNGNGQILLRVFAEKTRSYGWLKQRW
jgi:hypothetical protein